MTDQEEIAVSLATAERLLTNQRQFLSFLEKRLPSKAAAEEVLQDGFLRALEKADDIQNADSAVAWFYRLLRNSVADYYRRRASHQNMVEQRAHEIEESEELEFRNAICECISGLLPNLKPEYAEMIRRVDLGEEPLENVATDLVLTKNNATVRHHRARQALKKQLQMSCGMCSAHGCLDCGCHKAEG